MRKNYFSRKIYLLQQASKKKTLVYLISTMRSGSTLLKSLLASAPDVSHLPEVDFQKYNRWNAWKLKALSKQPIIVLKKPAAFNEPDYPQFPTQHSAKKIILIRDAYETILSLKKMMQQAYPDLATQWDDARLLQQYWYPVNQALFQYANKAGEDTILIRYEDLLKDPIQVTAKLYQFIGSKQAFGLDTYQPPSTYTWAWGNDDGGQKIKSHKVQNLPLKRDNQSLLQLIDASDEVAQLRQKLGYH
jgi:hypothetical protein